MARRSGEEQSHEAELAERLIRNLAALSTQELRARYLRDTLGSVTPLTAVRMLEWVWFRARGGRESARALLVALAAVVQDPSNETLLSMLRRCLEREPGSPVRALLHVVTRTEVQDAPEEGEKEEAPRVPDYGKGRVLTLGERKALARRPERAMFDKLLLDPHPAVIRNVLANPMTTEDDVVKLAARRPLRAEVIQEIVRHPRWNVRRRVRMALVLNPHTPAEVGVPLVGLLLRSELRMTLNGPDTNAEVRAAAELRLKQMKQLDA